ncbi:hypothetical protein ENBRE01_0474 [Enteropsectra breve]|nr:hypothetical protein ENBRE01_0474 [Enteropsectra breve]
MDCDEQKKEGAVHRLKLSENIDAIAETDEFVVIGSYNYAADGKRTGSVQFLDKETHTVSAYFPTSGTLSIAVHDNLVYAANCGSLEVYSSKGKIKEVSTETINTYIFCGPEILLADVTGKISIFNYNFELENEIKPSDAPVWIVKEIEGVIFFGTESGSSYAYKKDKREIFNFSKDRLGILDFVKSENVLYVSSYDDAIMSYSFDTFQKLDEIKNVGSLWKIIKSGNRFYCSSIYDGLKIFDSEFKLLSSIATESICYAICLPSNNLLYWASFYDGTLMYSKLDENGLPA